MNSTKQGNGTLSGSVERLCGSWEYPIPEYIIIVMGFIANFAICFVFACYQRIRTVNNFFVFNLAISDMLLIFQLCLYKALPRIEETLTTQKQRLYLNVFMRILETFCGTASIATLTVISYDRHYSVTKPLYYTANTTPEKAVLFIVGIWIHSAVIALLRLVGRLPNKDVFKYGYFPLLTLCNAVIPFSITVYCYTTIFRIASRHLRHNPHQNQGANSSANILTKNLKIAIHVLVLVAPPVVYWSAYYSVSIIDLYCGKDCSIAGDSCVANWFISMTSSILATIDPIIYIFLTKDFRKIIFSWFRCRNEQHFISETIHLSTTRAPNSQTSPTSPSRRRFPEMWCANGRGLVWANHHN